MTIPGVSTRRTRLVARPGAVVGATLVVLGLWAVAAPSVQHASAAPIAGTAVVVDDSPGAGVPLTSGGSATAFSLRLPGGASCTGDSANAGYRVQSYMVPATVDPGTLTFGSNGPLPSGTGAAFRQPLYGTGTSPYVNQQTANADVPGGPGLIIGIPAFNFGVFAPGDIAAGTYDVGLACTLGPASATQVDKFWNVEMVVTASAADVPAGINWTVAAPPSTTTSTTSTSTTSTSTTSTSNSTSVPGSSTSSSSTPSSSTTSTTASGATGSTTTSTTRPTPTTSQSSATTTTSTTSGIPAGTLARTGGSPVTLVLLAALLLDLGWWVLRRRAGQTQPSSAE